MPQALRRSEAMAEQIVLSVVVPIHNEEGNIQELHRRLKEVLDSIGPCEIIFVDDGSTDDSVARIEEVVRANPRTRLVELSRNFGKEMAMLAGYDHCAGQAAVVVDADLQTPPEVIREMVQKWRQGAEIVDGVRQSTIGQGFMRRLYSRWFYWLMRKLAKTNIVPDSVDFRLMDRKVFRQIRACRERFRFNRGLAGWVGFRREAVTFVADQRFAGATRWSIRRLCGYAMDAIFSFSSVPLRVTGLLGLVISILSFIHLVWLVADNLIRGLPIPGYATIAGGIFLLGGVQLLGIWVLGEYVGRLYEEAKGRPPYVTRRVISNPPGDDAGDERTP
jgi:glycosyltransferase involved in cell wall biosynthesis